MYRDYNEFIEEAFEPLSFEPHMRSTQGIGFIWRLEPAQWGKTELWKAIQKNALYKYRARQEQLAIEMEMALIQRMSKPAPILRYLEVEDAKQEKKSGRDGTESA